MGRPPDLSAPGPRRRADLPARGLAPWDKGLDSIAEFERLEVLYWLHESRRDMVLQAPKSDGNGRGVFSLRTPVRPSPIGTSIVQVVRVEGSTLIVRGLDCLDGTLLRPVTKHEAAPSAGAGGRRPVGAPALADLGTPDLAYADAGSWVEMTKPYPSLAQSTRSSTSADGRLAAHGPRSRS